MFPIDTIPTACCSYESQASSHVKPRCSTLTDLVNTLITHKDCRDAECQKVTTHLFSVLSKSPELENVFQSIIAQSSSSNLQQDEAEKLYQQSMELKEKSPEKAKLMLRKAMKKGHGQANFEYGVEELLSSNGKRGFDEIATAALKGHVKAIDYVGRCFKDGAVQEKSTPLADLLVRLANEINDLELAIEIDEVYYAGINYLKQDRIKKGVACIMYAASNDHKNALMKLAKLYRNGKGINQNENMALIFYKRAAQLGDKHALVQWTKFLFKNDKIEEAKKYLLDLSLNGNAQAKFLIWKKSCVLHFSNEQADQFLEDSAKLGYPKAIEQIDRDNDVAEYIKNLNLNDPCEFSEPT